VKEQFDITQGVLDVVLFGAAVYVVSEAWIKAKAFIKDRTRDKAASDALTEAFNTPESDERLKKLTQELIELNKREQGEHPDGSAMAVRTAHTDSRLVTRNMSSQQKPEN
jgi:hypothetical protein